jgi:hypothetical protein
VSPDGRYVFSAGEDGTVFIFAVSEITTDGDVVTAKSTKDIKEGSMD